MKTLVGPFTQLVTMNGDPISDAGIIINKGIIEDVGQYKALEADNTYEIEGPAVTLPGFIDCHTHICWAGSRAGDYAKRCQGIPYQKIAEDGGGILDTVHQTRKASLEQLATLVEERAMTLLEFGVTTAEVKSGYGLTVQDELKMLRAIHQAKAPVTLIPTCLAAHTLPPEYDDQASYLKMLSRQLLPKVREEKLSNRVDIFIEEHAFSSSQAKPYLMHAKELGFDITIHADQFSPGGSRLAQEVGAISADHLEVLQDPEPLRAGHVIPVVLPGASLGLGTPFAPARKLLDAGLPLAIASDWNPGSAPMGDLLTQSCLLAAAEHLSVEETLKGITVHAAKALRLCDRGCLKPGLRADFTIFPTHDVQEIFYYQGAMKPRWCFFSGQGRIGVFHRNLGEIQWLKNGY